MRSEKPSLQQRQPQNNQRLRAITFESGTPWGLLGSIYSSKGERRKGEVVRQRRWYPHLFGKLKGLGVWLQLDQQL